MQASEAKLEPSGGYVQFSLVLHVRLASRP